MSPLPRPVAVAPPGADSLPILSRPEALDLALAQWARSLFEDFLRGAELAQEFLDGQYWVNLGYPNAETYCFERLGVSLRTLQRYLAVRQSVLTLPPEDIGAATTALVELGSHRAAALCPVLRHEPAKWREWAELAKDVNPAQLQERVSQAFGLRPRGRVTEPGERWYRAVLGHGLPQELVEQTQRAFALAARQLGQVEAHPHACWAAILAEATSQWEPRHG